MTGNIDPRTNNSSADAMRMRNAVIKMCGETYDPVILLCMHLQEAVDKKTFATMLSVMEMSEAELEKMIGMK